MEYKRQGKYAYGAYTLVTYLALEDGELTTQFAFLLWVAVSALVGSFRFGQLSRGPDLRIYSEDDEIFRNPVWMRNRRLISELEAEIDAEIDRIEANRPKPKSWFGGFLN